MSLAIQAALDDFRTMNASKSWWARFECYMQGNQEIVNLTYGVVHGNGFVENRLKTATYYMKPDGTVGVTV